MYFVYILQCADDSYYVGFSDNPDTRLALHHEGRGSFHTRKYRPAKLVYREPCDGIASARRRERQIKKWTRAKKEALIAGDLQLLKRL